MSKRLQVILPDEEFRALRDVAKRHKTTVADWVRRALHLASKQEPLRSPEDKMRGIREASKYNFPAPDINQMNREIEEGYRSGLS